LHLPDNKYQSRLIVNARTAELSFGSERESPYVNREDNGPDLTYGANKILLKRMKLHALSTISLSALLICGCDPVYHIRRSTDFFPMNRDLSCIEAAIKSVPEVTFGERRTYPDVVYFDYRFNGLSLGRNVGEISIQGVKYKNSFVTTWKSQADKVRSEVEPILIKIDEAVKATCKITFETKQSG
jgi:hypothetical protein